MNFLPVLQAHGADDDGVNKAHIENLRSKLAAHLPLRRDLCSMRQEPLHRAFDGGHVLVLAEKAVFTLHEHLAILTLRFAFGGEFDTFTRTHRVGGDDRSACRQCP